MLRLVFVTVLLASPAWALEQADHRDLSIAICLDAGLPEAFCERVGTEAHNVDRWEWETMAAHGQPEPGQSACAGLQATADRVDMLGRELGDWIAKPPSSERTQKLARALGRALHTVQDNCAHEGVPNVQHAWYSLMDTCEGAHASPDARPEAMTCAKSETAAVIRAFTAVLGAQRDGLEEIESGLEKLPPRDGICEYLDSAEQWDGIDRGWNNSVATPLLRARFQSAVIREDQTWNGVCDGGDAALFKVPATPIDVSGGPPSCKRVDAYCVGQADAADEPPPWGSDDSSPAGGCAAAGAGESRWLALYVVAWVLVRRRRRT